MRKKNDASSPSLVVRPAQVASPPSTADTCFLAQRVAFVVRRGELIAALFVVLCCVGVMTIQLSAWSVVSHPTELGTGVARAIYFTGFVVLALAFADLARHVVRHPEFRNGDVLKPCAVEDECNI